MRVLLGLMVFSFIGLSACQPKDLKIVNPRFSKSNDDKNTAAQKTTEVNPVSHEDMFQYALTRLHQGIQLSRLNEDSDSCIKKATTFEDSRYRIVRYSAYAECSLIGALQSEGLQIVGSRALYEVSLARKNAKKDFSIDNLESVVLSTKNPLNVKITPAEESKRKGSVEFDEEISLNLIRLESADAFQFIFITESGSDINDQKVEIHGELHFDAVAKKLTKLYLKDLKIKDERVLKSSTHTMEIKLQYKEANDPLVPALVFDINEQECWMLSGQGFLKKAKNGFVNYVEEKAEDKQQSKQKSTAGVVSFDINKEQLTMGQQVTKWPTCTTNPSGLAVAYGAIFLK